MTAQPQRESNRLENWTLYDRFLHVFRVSWRAFLFTVRIRKRRLSHGASLGIHWRVILCMRLQQSNANYKEHHIIQKQKGQNVLASREESDAYVTPPSCRMNTTQTVVMKIMIMTMNPHPTSVLKIIFSLTLIATMWSL